MMWRHPVLILSDDPLSKTLADREHRTGRTGIRSRHSRLAPFARPEYGGSVYPNLSVGIGVPSRSRTAQEGAHTRYERTTTMSKSENDPLMNSTRYGSVMSTPNINQLVGEAGGHHAKFNRSSSVGPGIVASNLNPQQRNRRALYVNLPFFRRVDSSHGSLVNMYIFSVCKIDVRVVFQQGEAQTLVFAPGVQQREGGKCRRGGGSLSSWGRHDVYVLSRAHGFSFARVRIKPV